VEAGKELQTFTNLYNQIARPEKLKRFHPERRRLQGSWKYHLRKRTRNERRYSLRAAQKELDKKEGEYFDREKIHVSEETFPEKGVEKMLKASDHVRPNPRTKRPENRAG